MSEHEHEQNGASRRKESTPRQQRVRRFSAFELTPFEGFFCIAYEFVTRVFVLEYVVVFCRS